MKVLKKTLLRIYLGMIAISSLMFFACCCLNPQCDVPLWAAPVTAVILSTVLMLPMSLLVPLFALMFLPKSNPINQELAQRSRIRLKGDPFDVFRWLATARRVASAGKHHVAEVSRKKSRSKPGGFSFAENISAEIG